MGELPYGVRAVAFDCYGTLVDFGDDAFRAAYGLICAEQGLAVDGDTFYEKWLEVWRRLARGSSGESADQLLNRPAPLSAAEAVPPHPQHHTPSAGRNRSLDGPLPPFRAYSEEWPEHFAICFEELGVPGDPHRAHQRLVGLMAEAEAFPDARRVVEAVGRRLPVAVLSNADDSFLHPVLAKNGIQVPIVVSSESARAYKPHVAIFRHLSERLGLEPERILYVGDSRLADVAGAKNAGMRAAWVRRPSGQAINRAFEVGRDQLPFQADFEIDRLDRVLDILGLREA